MPLKLNNDSDYHTDTDFETSCLVEIGRNEEHIQIENFISSQAQEQIPLNALNAVIKFHLDGEGHGSLTREVFKQSGLFAVAIFGVIFYYVPAKAYAKSICADPGYQDISCAFFVINHVAGTMLVAGGILMSATNTFFDRQMAENIPFTLANYLQYPFSPKQKLVEDAVTFAGSFIASIPFIIITVVNPIPGLPKLLITSQAFIVGVTNTLLHLLPFKLALKNPLYRVPFLPLEFSYHVISNALQSEEKKQEKAFQKSLNLGYQTIKQRLINHLDLAQRLLSIYGFKYTECSYINTVNNDIKDIQASSQPPLVLLTQLLARLHEMSPRRVVSPPGIVNNFFRKMVYIPGASWVILACAGFWGGTYNEMVELTGSSLSGTIVSAPSIYCLGVLLAFFGGNALQNSYDYLTAWNDDSVKILMAFKLYPKTSVLLIMISMYLSAFSYAAGAQLINDNFNGKLEFLRPYLLDLAKTGLTFLGFTAMIDFFNNVLKKFGQYGGAEDTQTVANLFEALNQLKDSIQLMKPKLLLESLAEAKEEQLKVILNINNYYDLEVFSASLIQLADTLKTKIIKEAKLIDIENGDNRVEDSLSELVLQLDNDLSYTVEKIEPLINYFSKKLELNENLFLSLRIFRQYKAVCEVMEKLGSVKLINDRELDVLPHGSINDDNLAGPPTERTRLLPTRDTTSINNIRTYLFRRHHSADNDRASSLSPLLSNSNQMTM